MHCSVPSRRLDDSRRVDRRLSVDGGKVKAGDLVNFHTDAWVFKSAEKDYRNPGVIIGIDDSHRQLVYTVMWADKKITREHAGYLQGVEK